MSDEIQQVKDKIDIVSFISQYVPLKKSGRNYKGLCPFHAEKTPSFMVSPELQIFKCFGCNLGGDLIKFFMLREGVEFRPALEELAQKAGVKLKFRPSESPEDKRREAVLAANSLSSQFYHFLLVSHSTGSQALTYLKERGLTLATIKKFLLGYAPLGSNSLTRFLLKKGFSASQVLEAGLSLKSERDESFYDRFRGRIIFPLVDVRGQTVGFSGRSLVESSDSPKYLNSPETSVFRKSAFLYGLNFARPVIKKLGRAILVEGQMDLLSNVQAGVENIVATSGTALTADQARALRRLSTEVVVCFDRDAAGQQALERAVEVCEGEGLVSLVAHFPEGVKDPDEAVRLRLNEWKKNLQNPISFYDYYFDLHGQGLLKSDATAKRKATEKLLTVIAKMANPLEKAHFTKRLAQDLDLPEKFVQESLSKLSPSKTSAATTFGESLVGGALVNLKGQPRLETLRRYFLSLLLRFNFDLVKKTLAKVSPKDFETSPLFSIFTVVREFLSRRARAFKVRTIRDLLEGEAQGVFDELLLFDLGVLETDANLQAKEIGVVFKELKREVLKEEVGELLNSIREAEKSKKDKDLKDLQKRLNVVYQKLKD